MMRFLYTTTHLIGGIP